MLKNNTFLFTLCFCFILLGDLLMGSVDFELGRFVTKPLILISLIFYFKWKGNTIPQKTYTYIKWGLWFSLFGDVSLLFNGSTIYFSLGLAFFLTAHIFYSLGFLERNKKNFSSFLLLTLCFFGTYGIVLYLKLLPFLGSLSIPVFVYILAILTMGVLAINRFKMVTSKSFSYVAIGAILFMISDSLLAINKFITPIHYSHLLVMGTYGIAQFCIVKGILANGK